MVLNAQKVVVLFTCLLFSILLFGCDSSQITEAENAEAIDNPEEPHSTSPRQDLEQQVFDQEKVERELGSDVQEIVSARKPYSRLYDTGDGYVLRVIPRGSVDEQSTLGKGSGFFNTTIRNPNGEYELFLGSELVGFLDDDYDSFDGPFVARTTAEYDFGQLLDNEVIEDVSLRVGYEDPIDFQDEGRNGVIQVRSYPDASVDFGDVGTETHFVKIGAGQVYESFETFGDYGREQITSEALFEDVESSLSGSQSEGTFVLSFTSKDETSEGALKEISGSFLDVSIAAPPTAVNLTNPNDGAVIEGTQATLEWDVEGDPSPYPTYKVYVGTDPSSFGAPATETQLTSFVASDLEFDKTYYWKVEAKNRLGEVVSEVRSFDVVEPPLSASIDGPLTVEHLQEATWTADVENAKGTTTDYSWTVNQVSGQEITGSGESISVVLANDTYEIDSATVELNVSSGGETDTATFSTNVVPGGEDGDDCPPSVFICEQ